MGIINKGYYWVLYNKGIINAFQWYATSQMFENK